MSAICSLRLRSFIMTEHAKVCGRAADDCKVSKSQLLRFVEAKFNIADRDQDGQLNITELSNFLRFVTHPDLRALQSWDRYR